MIIKDDNELVYEVIQGSISSFEVLIDRYQKTIFNLMLRMVNDTETAKDLTQDLFVKAYEKIGGFNFKFRFFSWIYRMAFNMAIDWNRKRQPACPIEMVESRLSDTPEPNDSEIRSNLLHVALRKLDPDYRVLVLLKYYCGLSYQEIQETTGIPLKKVRSRLFIAREQLRKGLIVNDFFEHD
ncbi:MAG: RNA polymerase sigma factor [Bacteroidetes bacterium]|nr:RNA polymerase sigma factor [Bacteroidota bacterium]